LFRQVVSLSLKNLFSRLEIVEAGTLGEALEAVQTGGPFTVVLFDLDMPDCRGRNALAEMIQAAQGTPVVVVSASENPSDILNAIDTGARGYILKSSSIEAFRHALPLVLCGETFIPIPVTGLGALAQCERAPIRPTATSQPPGNGPFFTQRQLEVARLLVQGRSNKQIANQLGVFEGTVKVHVRDIARKLGVNNRTQAAIAATQLKLVE
jgi:DNA-binding NarL/FixJ family response regulator